MAVDSEIDSSIEAGLEGWMSEGSIQAPVVEDREAQFSRQGLSAGRPMKLIADGGSPPSKCIVWFGDFGRLIFTKYGSFQFSFFCHCPPNNFSFVVYYATFALGPRLRMG